MLPIIETCYKTCIRSTSRFAIILRSFTTKESCNVMLLSKIKFIRKSISPNKRETISMALAYLRLSITTLRGKLINRSIRTIIRSTIINSKYSTELQVLDRFNLHINISIQSTISALGITVHHHSTIRVTIIYIPIRTYCRIVIAICIINRNNRRCRESTTKIIVVDVTSVHTTALLVNKTDMLTNGYQPIPHLMF